METALIEVTPVRSISQATGPRYRVLLHNDEVTPLDYVLHVLNTFFFLSEELAEHVAWTAHNEGTAIVAVRPRPDAERLITVANTRAKLDGYPLKFTLEED